MRFSLLALSVQAALAHRIKQRELVQVTDSIDDADDNALIPQAYAEKFNQMALAENADASSESEEEASRHTAKEKAWGQKYAKVQHRSARYIHARDACKNEKPSNRRACFIRQWRLFKPKYRNTLHDFRARANRKCKKMSSRDKVHECLKAYIKTYESQLHWMIFAQAQSEMQGALHSLIQQKHPTLQERNQEAHYAVDSTDSLGDATPTEGEDSENSDDPEWEIQGRRQLFKGNDKLTKAIKVPTGSLISDDDKKPASLATSDTPYYYESKAQKEEYESDKYFWKQLETGAAFEKDNE